jgi:hypothetical protein
MLENQPKQMPSTDIGDLIIHLGYQVPEEHNGNIFNKEREENH